MKCGSCESEARWSAGGGAVPEVLACDRCRAEADAESAEPLEWGGIAAERDPKRHCFREDSPTDECSSCGALAEQHSGCDCDA